MPADELETKRLTESFVDAACLVFFCMSVLLATKWPFSSVKFCERNQLLSLFLLALLGGQQLTSEATGTALNMRTFPHSKILQDLRSRGNPKSSFSFSREKPPSSSSVLHPIRLRGGGGDGSVLHDKVVHNIKGAAVRAKATKLPDGSYSCLFTYDGGDALTLQVLAPPRRRLATPRPHAPPRLRARSGASLPSRWTSGSTPPCSATAAPTQSTLPVVSPSPAPPRRPSAPAARAAAAAAPGADSAPNPSAHALL
jgi:hypothetical protein